MDERITHLFLIYQSVVTFAFTNSRSLNTYCSGTWLHVVVATTTLISTLSNLKGFDTIVAIVVGLVWNMF
jgi:hypothetical protein